MHDDYRVDPGTILIALPRPITNDSVKACLYPLFEDAALLNQRVAMLKPYSDLLGTLLLPIIRSDSLKDAIRRASSETMQPNVSPKDLGRFPIPLAPESEQSAIADKLGEMLAIANEARRLVSRQLVRAQRLRQSILKRAFEGKLVEQDSGDEPASVLLDRIRASRDGNDSRNSQNVRPGRKRRKNSRKSA